VANRALFELHRRNELAQAIISGHASAAGNTGGALGAVGLASPGGGIMSMIGSLAMQAPTVYQPMARELARVYAADSITVARLESPTPENLQALDNPEAGALGDYLAGEFGYDFLSSTLTGMLPELGIGAATNLLPGALRALIGTGLNSSLASTLTWRIGMMTVLFALNDWKWVHNKTTTAVLARRIVGKPQSGAEDRVQLHDILQHLPRLHAQAAAGIAEYVREWRRREGSLTDAVIREGLVRQGVTVDVIDAALRVR
jgi:hypothetical protein